MSQQTRTHSATRAWAAIQTHKNDPDYPELVRVFLLQLKWNANNARQQLRRVEGQGQDRLRIAKHISHLWALVEEVNPQEPEWVYQDGEPAVEREYTLPK